MSQRVDPALLDELKAYGDVNIEACFNCGNCTAICPLSTDETPFPRNNIRLLQMGLRDRILESTDSWLCYYCGECSETCPKGAEPGESQMAIRRWLTAQYDWSGLGSLLYQSRAWAFGTLFFVALLVILLATFLHGPIVTERVELNTFAPVHLVHTADLIMAAGLTLYIAINVFRMHNFLMRGRGKGPIPIGAYISELWKLPFHLITQKRYLECDDKRPWYNHMVLFVGYGLMFVVIVFLLGWFQTDAIYPLTNPQRWVGYLAAGGIIYGCSTAIWGRLKKNREMHRFSHFSDWLFPLILVLLAVTGILVHIFRYLGLPLATYYMYVVHLVFVPSTYLVVGPMGKWAHMFYRPLAVYFQAVNERATQMRATSELAPVGGD